VLREDLTGGFAGRQGDAPATTTPDSPRIHGRQALLRHRADDPDLQGSKIGFAALC